MTEWADLLPSRVKLSLGGVRGFPILRYVRPDCCEVEQAEHVTECYLPKPDPL